MIVDSGLQLSIKDFQYHSVVTWLQTSTLDFGAFSNTQIFQQRRQIVSPPTFLQCTPVFALINDFTLNISLKLASGLLFIEMFTKKNIFKKKRCITYDVYLLFRNFPSIYIYIKKFYTNLWPDTGKTENAFKIIDLSITILSSQ